MTVVDEIYFAVALGQQFIPDSVVPSASLLMRNSPSMSVAIHDAPTPTSQGVQDSISKKFGLDVVLNLMRIRSQGQRVAR